MDSMVAHRLRLRTSYDGIGSHGRAVQPGLRTVEGTVTEALDLITGGSHILTIVGRIDAGVHARDQVIHVDVNENKLARAAWHAGDLYQTIMCRLSALLARESSGPKGSSDITVTGMDFAPVDFDARFPALSRTYPCRVCDDPVRFDPLRYRGTLWLREPLDIEAMSATTCKLMGEHDSVPYCKSREGATTIRELLELKVKRKGGLAEMTTRANAFCHPVVRAPAGSLLKVGAGRHDEEWPARRLGERSHSGEVAVTPPHPFTSESVKYPEDSQLAARVRLTRILREMVEDREPEGDAGDAGGATSGKGLS